MSDLPDEVEKYTAEYEAKKRSFKEAGGKIERPEVVFKRGARFFLDEKTGKTMFAYKSSAVNEYIGKATDTDREKFPQEWIDFAKTQKGAKK